MTRRRPGAVPEPQPMTPDQVADLIARVRANTSPRSVAAGRATAARWAKYRADKESR